MEGALFEWADSLGAVFSGGGQARSRKVGRFIVIFIAVLNLSIFYTNLRWMLSSAESMGTPAGMPVDLRPSGYGRGVATFVGKLFMARDVESRKFNIDPTTGEFIPIKETRPKPDKYFVSHPVVVSGVTSTTMSAVRQLVGSIHFWHPELTVWLYEIGTLTERHRSEVALWEDTELFDGMQVLRMVLTDPDLTLERGPLGGGDSSFRSLFCFFFGTNNFAILNETVLQRLLPCKFYKVSTQSRVTKRVLLRNIIGCRLLLLRKMCNGLVQRALFALDLFVISAKKYVEVSFIYITRGFSNIMR